MPTYEYRCPNGHAFEVFQRMSDAPVSECPECGAPAERKISGGVGFLFKGDGFYITESRSDDYKKKASAETSAPADSSKKDSASTDSGSAKSTESPAPSPDG